LCRARAVACARGDRAIVDDIALDALARSPNDLLGRFCDRANHIGFTRARRAGTLIVSL
jgi:hypothetical protein